MFSCPIRSSSALFGRNLSGSCLCIHPLEQPGRFTVAVLRIRVGDDGHHLPRFAEQAPRELVGGGHHVMVMLPVRDVMSGAVIVANDCEDFRLFGVADDLRVPKHAREARFAVQHGALRPRFGADIDVVDFEKLLELRYHLRFTLVKPSVLAGEDAAHPSSVYHKNVPLSVQNIRNHDRVVGT